MTASINMFVSPDKELPTESSSEEEEESGSGNNDNTSATDTDTSEDAPEMIEATPTGIKTTHSIPSSHSKRCDFH